MKLLKHLFLSVGCIFMIFVSCISNEIVDQFSSKTDLTGPYLGQPTPDNTPGKFPFSVSTGYFAAERIAISSDGNEIYYSEIKGDYTPISKCRIKYYKSTNNIWDGPHVLFEGYNSPSLDIDGNTMYFQDFQLNTWESIRNGTTWSDPVEFHNENTYKKHYLQETNSQLFYLSTDASGGLGQNDFAAFNETTNLIQNLGLPLNSSGNELDFYIAKDESFIIFAKDTGGGRPMYISYHNNDKSWSAPVNLGKAVNSHTWYWGVCMSLDQQYLFFSAGSSPSNYAIYWVKINNIITDLNNSN